MNVSNRGILAVEGGPRVKPCPGFAGVSGALLCWFSSVTLSIHGQLSYNISTIEFIIFWNILRERGKAVKVVVGQIALTRDLRGLLGFRYC